MQHRTRIKICGLTRTEDIRAAVQAGADALGFVLYPESPRYVDMAHLRELAQVVPAFVSPVLLFVNAAPTQIEQALTVVPQALLQFHGDETPADCQRYQRPYLRAARVHAGLNLVEYAQAYMEAGAQALLLDTYTAAYGGSGKTFDWSLIPKNAAFPTVLSGGLDSENVAEGVRLLRPWAVDVSSGVEQAKGIKDPNKIAQFIAAVRTADLQA